MEGSVNPRQLSTLASVPADHSPDVRETSWIVPLTVTFSPSSHDRPSSGRSAAGNSASPLQERSATVQVSDDWLSSASWVQRPIAASLAELAAFAIA